MAAPVQKTGYLHFELWNCGNNVPQVVGNPFAIVAQQFDIRPSPTTGLISSAVYGKDQILCGNVASTEWLITEFPSGRGSAVRWTGLRFGSYWELGLGATLPASIQGSDSGRAQGETAREGETPKI
jgi:hypothetical protein